MAAQHRPHLRQWRDLSKWRLLIALAFAPVPPIVLGALILLIMGAGFFIMGLGGVLAAAEIWSLPVGTIFLAMARLRGTVRRAHCFLLGAFLALSLPEAAYWASHAIDWAFSDAPIENAEDYFNGSFHGPSDGMLMLLLGLFLVPFGTLGGWVFWRVGVYPARPKVIDAAAVFD